MQFTNAYATSSTSTPSRFGLLTGMYPWRQKNTGIAPGILRAQTLNILHSVKGACIENMGRLAAAVAGNAIRGLLKSAGFQRVGVIPEGGQAQLGLPLLLFLLVLRRFELGDGVVTVSYTHLERSRTFSRTIVGL